MSNMAWTTIHAKRLHSAKGANVRQNVPGLFQSEQVGEGAAVIDRRLQPPLLFYSTNVLM